MAEPRLEVENSTEGRGCSGKFLKIPGNVTLVIFNRFWHPNQSILFLKMIVYSVIFNTLEHPILNENRTASRACKVRGLQKTASSKSPTKEVTTVDKFKFVSIMRHRSSLKIQSLFFSF